MDGNIKVGDFGLVKSKFDNGHGSDSQDFGEYKLYSPKIGTYLYMSPEQLALKPYNYKVDIYALGVIWMELLVTFQTDIERVHVLSGLRKCEFPQKFPLKHPHEYEILFDMLSEDPEVRPTASVVKGRHRSMYKSVYDVDQNLI